MTEPPIVRLIHAARGKRPVDLLLRNARLINVYLGEVVNAHIAITDGHIAGFGACEARHTLDLKGQYVAPGFIDAHVHLESSMISAREFARAVVPCGTTAVVADPHEMANVLGVAGIEYMLATSEGQALRFFFTLPSCVPSTTMETAGAVLEAADLQPFMSHGRIRGLAEMMNYPGVIEADPGVLDKIKAMRDAGKPVDGHAPGLGGALLYAYLVPGIASDHESVTAREAHEKLAAGLHIMVREGSAAHNLKDLLPLINTRTARRMMWCTDDRYPHDLLDDGHIDGILRQAIRYGLDPVTAIQMATLNPAEYFRLDDLGAVAPGKQADLVIFDDLKSLVIRQVYVGGRRVARDGALAASTRRPAPVGLPTCMHVPLERLDFRVAPQGSHLRVIQVVPDQILTVAKVMEACIIDGQAISDVSRDLLKIVEVERHHGSGRSAAGFIHGFGLQRGALASSVAHDSHNIVAVGVVDRDLHLAVETLVNSGGGLAVVADGRILAHLPLPIAGLMTDQPLGRVRRQLDKLLAAARQLGNRLANPFITLSFMALPVIPELKITDRGLVDVVEFRLVPLFVED